MRPLLSLTLFTGFAVSCAAVIDSIQNVPDIQSNIWCYLRWEERLILRSVSISYDEMHRHLFPSECGTVSQFVHLSRHIHTIDPPKLIPFFLAKEILYYIEPFSLDQRFLMEYGCMLIEKIMVDIIERALSFVDASRACMLWLKPFWIRFPPFECHKLQSHRWPTLDLNDSVVPCHYNLDKLDRMFQLAKYEMNRTKSKYNRYTRFAFVFLDSFLMSLDEMGPNTVRYNRSVNNFVRQLWNDIASVEFIADYLVRPQLRDFQEPAVTAIELIMIDAVGINDTLNTDRMLLMVDHPRILFNFHVVFFEMVESPIWSKKTRTECINFIVSHQLMSWSAMEEYLRDYRSVYPAEQHVHRMWRYVYSRHIRDKISRRYIHSGNPLVRRKDATNRSMHIVHKPTRMKHDCCLCM